MHSVKQYAVLLALLSVPGLCPGSVQAAPSSGGDVASLLTMNLEQLIELDVTIATGTSKSLRTAPAVASVITAEDIEAMGATTLEEALETVPGLHVGASFGCMAPTYSIRGIQTGLNPQVLVLVNGLPITYLYNGRRAFGFQMPVSNISRIEVVRGPGSAVFGADAFAGTINVITKDAQEIDGTKAGLRAGSFSTYDTWLEHGGTYGGWETALSLEYRESDGDKDRIATSDLQTQFDSLINTPFGLPPASLAPGTLATQYRTVTTGFDVRRGNWTARLYGFLQDDAGVGPSGTQVVDPAGSVDTSLLLADVNYQEKVTTDLELGVRLSYLYQHEETLFQMFPPGALVPIGDDGNIGTPSVLPQFALYTQGLFGEPILTDQQTAVDYTALYTGLRSHRLRFGTGYRVQQEAAEQYSNFGAGVLDPATLFANGPVAPVDGTLTHLTDGPYVFLPDKTRKLWYVLGQDEWSLARRWDLIGGVRYDRYSDFGETVNPRLALVWETRDDLTSKLLYGRAFRAPSFAEEYNQNNPSAMGSPDVQPETIDTLELAFNYQPFAYFRTALNFFAYEIHDLIDYVQESGDTAATAHNVGDQTGRGFELELDWRITHTFRLRSNFAYQRSKDADTGETVPDAPAVQFYLNPHWEFLPDWSLDGQYYWIGDRHRAEGDTRPDIKDNNIVNLTLRRKNIAEHWTAALAVRNLFDEDVREPTPFNSDLPASSAIPNDYPMESRSLWAELRYSF